MTRQGMDMRQDYIHLKWKCEVLWLEGNVSRAGARPGLRPFNLVIPPTFPRHRSAKLIHDIKTACRWEADRLSAFMEQGLQHAGEERQRLAHALVQRR